MINLCFLCEDIIKKNELYQCIKCNISYDLKCKTNYLKEYEIDCPICYIPIMNLFNKVVNVYLKPSKFIKGFISELQYIDNNNNDIEIRCLKLDSRAHHQLVFPDYFRLKINNKEIKVYNPLEKNISIKLRKEIPLYINYKKFISNKNNTINIYLENYIDNKNTLKNDPKPIYIFMICSIIKLKDKNIIESSKKLNKLESINHIRLFFDKIKIIEKISWSLKCKLSLQKTKYPARGKYCDHIDFFCMRSHLEFLSKSWTKKFTCPICKKPLYEYIIDNTIYTLMKELRKYDSIKINNELKIFSDKEEYLGLWDNSGNFIKIINLNTSLNDKLESLKSDSCFEDFENNNEINIESSSLDELIEINSDSNDNDNKRQNELELEKRDNQNDLILDQNINLAHINFLKNFKLFQTTLVNAKINKIKENLKYNENLNKINNLN